MTKEEKLRYIEGLIAAITSIGPQGNPNGIFTITAEDVGLNKNDILLVLHPQNTVQSYHSHDFLEIIYALKGSCYQTIAGMELDLSAGDFCILSPGVQHGIVTAEQGSIAINILISKATVEAFVLNLFKDETPLIRFFTQMLYSDKPFPYILFCTGENSQIDDLVLDMFFEDQNRGRNSGLFLKSCLTMIFFLLMRQYETTITIGSSPGKEATTKLITYIREHYRDATLENTASFFHYSKSHISHTIKDATGVTFNDFLRDIRMKKAADLLVTTELPIHTIMDSVGYKDLSNFYKCFKATFGVTPKQYRGQNRSLEE